jgi:hypothetical protein
MFIEQNSDNSDFTMIIKSDSHKQDTLIVSSETSSLNEHIQNKKLTSSGSSEAQIAISRSSSSVNRNEYYQNNWNYKNHSEL